jgi:putative DNA primase/helicase
MIDLRQPARVDLRHAARALGGDIVGRDQVLCPGPGHSLRDRSLAVRFVANGFIVHSHANDDWQICRDHVSARLGLDSQRPATKPAPIRATPQPPDDTVDRIGWARPLWRETVPAKGTLAERYLVETRRLELPDSAAIRFHPRLKFPRNGEFLPAMICAMVDISTNEFTGIHRTFLTADAKKAGVLTLGRKLGSAIKIDADDAVHEGLAIAEGIESTIAARFIYRPAWSLIDANGINGFPVLPAIEHLSIFADNDANKTGEIAAYECQERWQMAGAEVAIQMPPNVGEDIADIISNRRIY